MKSLKEYIQQAEDTKTAIGHFNISDSVGFWAVVNAAQKLNLPVIIGVSEGERDFIGVKQVKALVETLKQTDMPIFLNADHTYSVERVEEVVNTGFDACIIDGSDKSFEENIKLTKEAVIKAKKINPNILIEGELGFIGKSSAMWDEIPEGADSTLTKPEKAEEFVKQTNIDLFAPSVGNIHGMAKNFNVNYEKLDIERIKVIRKIAGVPLVLHGGSGIKDDEFKQAITAGISVIHINTEMRVAYKQALQKSFSENPDETTPYKFLRPAVIAIQAVVEKRLILFNNL
ncbi:MAG: ketose-bisphosphate aldolase [Candidatus Zambryskibacteria bacterium]|nr:ketose-bisphosphate aldolase [Candidatus Zambryskibacteria bacterium]